MLTDNETPVKRKHSVILAESYIHLNCILCYISSCHVEAPMLVHIIVNNILQTYPI
jgi:hypothetical protein